MTFRRISVAVLLAASGALALASPRLVGSIPAELPTRLTDQQFWKLSDDLSEPDGVFQSDNLLSNELVFARAVPDLVARIKPGGVYLGVGPEQNFTYIAALKPKMAFITDVRRGNLHLHLMYKALFELSANREEFVSRLFTKPRPANSLPPGASAKELFAAFWETPTSDENVYAANLNAILEHLTKRRGLPLSSDDREGIARVYRAFHWYGPGMIYSARTGLSTPVGGRGTTYRDLMTQADASGQEYSYLASEESFNAVKELESRNLIVPVVGNFAGPKALKAVGSYVRDRGAIVNVFYLSNVESYLRRAGTAWTDFCKSVATFPLDETSVFIRPMGNGLPTTVHSLMANIGTPTGGVNGFTGVTFVTGTTGSADTQVRFVTVSGTNSARSALDPIAEEIKACASASRPSASTRTTSESGRAGR